MPSPPSPQRALLTGATGFIGSHVLRRLLAAGWEVHVLTRRSLNVPGVSSHRYTGNTEQVLQAFERCKPQVVFHLASLFLAQHTADQVAPLIQSNILLGTQILEAMSLTGTRALVNAGTSWQHFHHAGYRPVNLYAATKQAFEDILAFYADAHEIRAITLNLFDSYGPGDTRKKLIHLLLDCLRTKTRLQMSMGDQAIDLVHVDDLSRAFLHAAHLVWNAPSSALMSYAVSSGMQRTLREVVTTLEQVTGKKLSIQWGARPYRPREVMHLWNGPALPEWRAEITLERGLVALIQETPA